MPVTLALRRSSDAERGVNIGVFIGATSRGRSLRLAALALVVLAFTIGGMTIAPPPPSTFAMAASSLATLIVVSALSCWLGRLPAAPR